MSNSSQLETKSKPDVFDAINSATPDRLRTILTAICKMEPEAYFAVSEVLMIRQVKLKSFVREHDCQENIKKFKAKDDTPLLYREDDNVLESDYSNEGTGLDAATGTRRENDYSRQRFDICKQCEYEVLHDALIDCKWHDGNRSVHL